MPVTFRIVPDGAKRRPAASGRRPALNSGTTSARHDGSVPDAEGHASDFARVGVHVFDVVDYVVAGVIGHVAGQHRPVRATSDHLLGVGGGPITAGIRPEPDSEVPAGVRRTTIGI